ncbi:MAG: HemK/PrmC family methyltransferase, partial [Gallionella sp.]
MNFHIDEILRDHSKQLEATLSLDPGSARIEVQSLLQAVLEVDRAWLLSHPEQSLDTDQQERYMAWFECRLKGEPIAYLLGEREFYGLTFIVSPATLIPRPETELLVDLALQRIPQSGPFRVLDLGTGSGAIALSIARSRP